MFNLNKVIRENIKCLEPYRCARDDFKVGILLDANENTHGPAIPNLSPAQAKLELNRYPDPHQEALKNQICDFRNSEPHELLKGIPSLRYENLCLGVGSDESIDMLMRLVCTPGKDKILICPPTYGMYNICAAVNDVQIEKTPLTYPEFDIDPEAILAKIEADPNIKLLYLTSPGNPTSKLLNAQPLVDLIEKLELCWNGLVIVDEAYIDFSKSDGDVHGNSLATLVAEHDNLVVLQTLSKSFGLAGIRLGITFSSEKVSYYLNAMKYPYNISSLTSQVAITATSEGLNLMKDYVKSIISQRGYVLEQLQKIDGVGKNIGGLDANFILLEILDKTGKPSNEIAHQLYEQLATVSNIVVRFRGKELNCTGALRISIGVPSENKILLEKFKETLEKLRK